MAWRATVSAFPHLFRAERLSVRIIVPSSVLYHGLTIVSGSPSRRGLGASITICRRRTPFSCAFEQRTGRSPALHASKGKLIGTRQTIAIGPAHGSFSRGVETTSTLLLLTV